MPRTWESQAEEVFEGKGIAIHVAEEGLALTIGGQMPKEESFRSAGYDAVTAAQVEGGAKATLTVTFGDGRPPWSVPGMRRSHAEWAKAAIDRRTRRVAHRQSPLFSKPLEHKQLQAELQAMLQAAAPSAPDIADALLWQAVLHKASDVHLQPGANGLAVRWRVDGLLADVIELGDGVGERVISRLKVLANLASHQHDIAQEGRATVAVNGGVEARMTVLPTLQGETLTVRLFDPSRGIIPLDELGFEDEDLALYRRIIGEPDGMIVLTGPAGAGKTTTMYSSLLAHSAAAEGVYAYATVEQPVEYDLAFASQTEVNPDVGLTFARALATVLRQDPNVIMVGEIRDPETASIAVRAGMTGHLVFTTLHAGSSAGVFPRLEELEVPPYCSTSAVRCLVSQRLVRRLCACAQAGTPDDAALTDLGLGSADVADWEIKAPVGCTECNGSGYSGRVAVIQVAPVGEGLAELAMARASALQFEQKLREQGIPTLHELALRKVRRGITSLEEVARVLGRVR